MCFLVVYRTIPFTMKYFYYCSCSGNWWPIINHIPGKVVSGVVWYWVRTDPGNPGILLWHFSSPGKCWKFVEYEMDGRQ